MSDKPLEELRENKLTEELGGGILKEKIKGGHHENRTKKV